MISAKFEVPTGLNEFGSNEMERKRDFIGNFRRELGAELDLGNLVT